MTISAIAFLVGELAECEDDLSRQEEEMEWKICLPASLPGLVWLPSVALLATNTPIYSLREREQVVVGSSRRELEI